MGGHHLNEFLSPFIKSPNAILGFFFVHIGLIVFVHDYVNVVFSYEP